MRSCEHCGVVFEPRREHARFCSARCRVAWNREHIGGEPAGQSALQWAVAGMHDVTQRLGCLRPREFTQAFDLISEAVWWVTLVDATLVRYHPGEYDAAMARLCPAERRETEDTFGGLRFVRNRMGYYTDHADFVRLPAGVCDISDQPVTCWLWKPVPEPEPGSLPPRGQAWELDRHRAYQAVLAGRSVGETFGRATAFLGSAGARSIAEGQQMGVRAAW